eukprot:10726470-Alexandrium_andersonii.AAC.1
MCIRDSRSCARGRPKGSRQARRVATNEGRRVVPCAREQVAEHGVAREGAELVRPGPNERRELSVGRGRLEVAGQE